MAEERKLVTILFADVSGSTALGERLDPEDIRALMGRYYTHARQIIEHHGGTLEKFIGDAIMAIFGLPQAHSDDAERALAAALALRNAVQQDTLLKTVFTLHIGVNTGEVITDSRHTSNDFIVTGDAVNVAARLQQYAASTEILVGERTMDAARNAFVFGAAKELAIRGRVQTLNSYPLRCSRSTRQAEHPPFVGRKQDLLQLSILQARALEEQRTQLVSIIAPAGTGKTRLLEEFLKRLDPDAEMDIATMRCLPYGEAVTYLPLRSLLQSLLGKDLTHEAITEIFARGGHTQQESARLADIILTTLNIYKEGTTTTPDRESNFSAWRCLIELFAVQKPRIIVFEDLHWASDTLLDLLEYMLDMRIQAPLLLITLSRPELLERRSHWGGGWQNYTSLTLQPLTLTQTRNLVEHLLSKAPASVQEQIVERSGGNPFFTLELVRSASQHYTASQWQGTLSLPDTVHAALLARIDQLTPQERVIVQVASVHSRAFRYDMLQKILDEYSIQELDGALDSLVAHEFLQTAEAGSYTFRHILIRDVAYGTLSRAERIRLHSKVAATFEIVVGTHLDEYIELIAYHYREAVILTKQAALPTKLPIECNRAIHFLQRAGALASRAGAFAEARKHLESALEIAEEPQFASLYEQLGDCLTWGADVSKAYKKALDYWRKDSTRDSLTGARLLRKLLIGYTRGFIPHQSSKESLAQLLQEAYQLVEESGDKDELWYIHVADVYYHFWLPEISEQLYIEKKRLGLATANYFEQKKNWQAFSQALDAFAGLTMDFGEHQVSLEASQRRLQAPDLSGFERGDGIKMLVNAQTFMGDYDSCIQTIREILAHQQPHQPYIHLSTSISYAISAAFVTGRWSIIDELLEPLQIVWEQSQYDSSTLQYVSFGYYEVLEVALAREDRTTADRVAAILRRAYTDTKSTRSMLVESMLEDDPDKLIPDQTVKHSLLMRLLRFRNEHGLATPEIVHKFQRFCYTNSREFLLCKNISEALEANDNARLAETIETAETQQMIVHAARMRIVLAQRTGEIAHLELARPVLERVGDRQYLRKLREVEVALTRSVA